MNVLIILNLKDPDDRTAVRRIMDGLAAGASPPVPSIDAQYDAVKARGPSEELTMFEWMLGRHGLLKRKSETK